MRTNRRNFISTGFAGGLAAALPLTSGGSEAQGSGSGARKADYTRLDEILKQPVLKRELLDRKSVV